MIFNTKFNNYSLNFIKVLLIVKIEIKEQNTSLNLVLIQWYYFKSESHTFLYRYSRLELTEIYNFIDIETIQDIVHIIPRFNSNNEYFVNKFIFWFTINKLYKKYYCKVGLYLINLLGARLNICMISVILIGQFFIL